MVTCSTVTHSSPLAFFRLPADERPRSSVWEAIILRNTQTVINFDNYRRSCIRSKCRPPTTVMGVWNRVWYIETKTVEVIWQPTRRISGDSTVIWSWFTRRDFITVNKRVFLTTAESLRLWAWRFCTDIAQGNVENMQISLCSIFNADFTNHLGITRSIWKMLGPFATASRRTTCRYFRHHYQDEPKPAIPISQAACDSSDTWWMAMQNRCPQRQRQRVTEGTAMAP